MSKQQWGHGYWQGVKDTKTGKKRTRTDDEAAFMVCNMCIINADKDYDKSLFSVKEFISFCRFAGLNEKYAKRIYDYIFANEPYGCYVSGYDEAPWKDDYFVLPGETKEFWLKERAAWIAKDKEESNG